jgi:hypothetical protein
MPSLSRARLLVSGLFAASAGMSPAAASKAAAEPPGIVWGTPQPVSLSLLRHSGIDRESSGIRRLASPDGNAYTLIFSRATVHLGRNTRAINVSRIASLRIPVKLPAGKTLAGFKTDLRGFCAKDGHARVVLVADLGGTTVSKEFPYARSGVQRDFHLHAEPRSSRASPRSPPAYIANIAVFVQRRDTKSETRVRLDSLDIVPILR